MKLKFKSRNGNLSYGIGKKWVASGKKDTKINRNIIIGMFRDNRLNKELGLEEIDVVPTVEELLNEVIYDKARALRSRTLTTYKMSSKNWIIPYFRDVLVTKVKPIDIKKFQDSFIDKGLGNGSVNIARILLRDVFELAILKEIVTTNPVTMVSLPRDKKVKKKQKPFTLDEIDLILDSADSELRNFLGISFFTGVRSGELLALTWEDVDFATDTICIDKTIANGSINSAKTESSIRDIEMLQQAKKYLKLQQMESGLRNKYVFTPKKNDFHATNQIFYKRFRLLLDELGLQARSLHNTRHTFASMMLNNNIDVLWVSHMLGHKSIQMTLQIYTHYMPKKEKMSLGFLEKRYKKAISQ